MMIYLTAPYALLFVLALFLLLSHSCRLARIWLSMAWTQESLSSTLWASNCQVWPVLDTTRKSKLSSSEQHTNTSYMGLPCRYYCRYLSNCWHYELKTNICLGKSDTKIYICQWNNFNRQNITSHKETLTRIDVLVSHENNMTRCRDQYYLSCLRFLGYQGF